MKVILPVVFCFTIFFGRAQTEITRCGTSATEEFAMLTTNKDFQILHDLPTPYRHINQKGKMINFNTPDGSQGRAYAILPDQKTDNYLFVIHEWWGLNNNIKKEADRLFEQIGNVNVLALDLYDGEVATTREQASTLVRRVTKDRAKAIIKGAADHSGNNAKIATIGWCYGGGWSLQAAIITGEKAVGCVIYYGRPEKEVDRLKSLNCDVLGIFALQDQGIPPAMVQQFQQDMAAAGKTVNVHNFEAQHAFANPSSSRYNEAAAQEANKLSLAYLKTKLK